MSSSPYTIGTILYAYLKKRFSFFVGGGISSIEDVAPLLEAGADKVSINSAAVKNPDLIDQLARTFGSQFVVLAIDARKVINQWTVHTHGGTRPTDKKLFSWAKEGQSLAWFHHDPC